MKAAKLLFSIVLFPLLVQAQDIKIDDMVIYDMKTIDKFMKSTTYIVLDQHKESDYSLAITKVAEEYWKVTPYEIIDRATYREYQKDKTKSFLTREFIAGDENLISMSLFMGGQRYMDTKGKLLANVKLKHYTEKDEDFLYKLPTLVQNIQWKVKMVKNKKFESESDFQDYYAKSSNLLHSKKLFILNEHLTTKIKDLEKIEKFYKHDVTLVTRDVMTDAIVTQDSTVAFLSIVGPARNWGGQTAYYRIYSADKGETLKSYDRSVSSTAPLGVTGYDLKKFNK